MTKRVVLLALLGLCLMAPVTGGGPGGSPQTDCSNAVTSKVLYNTTTGEWSCGSDQVSGAPVSYFGTIGTAVADTGADTLAVNDGTTIDFTTADAPDSLTAEVKANTLTGSYLHFANTTRLMGRTTAGAGAGEEITVSGGSLLALAAGSLTLDDSDVMFASAYDTFATGFEVDYASVAGALDFDLDGSWEVFCTPASTKCDIDPNEDTTPDFTVNVGAGGYAGSNTLAIASAKGLGAGNGSDASSGNDSCIARDTTTNADRLFEDKDCDVMTGGTTTPEAGEGMLSNIIAKATSDHTLASTTGTEVTGLRIQLDVAGTYDVRYTILSQSSSAGVGLAYGVNYTGTTATVWCERSYPASAAATIASGNNGPIATEEWTTNAFSTTAPNLGPNTGGVQTINTTAMETVHCLVVVTTPGATAALRRLAFWHASETATNTSVMTDSVVSAERIN